LKKHCYLKKFPNINMDVLHDLKKLRLDSNILNLELSIISIMGS